MMTSLYFRASVLLLIGLTSACEQRVPKVSEQKLQELRRELPGITEQCLQIIRFGGLEAIPERVDHCFEMLPPQRWKGLWRDEFEGSQFCPSPAKTCSFDPPDTIWLTFIDNPEGAPNRPGGLYTIEFVGRRTLRPGTYGHLGAFQHEVIVDKLISLQRVGEVRR